MPGTTHPTTQHIHIFICIYNTHPPTHPPTHIRTLTLTHIQPTFYTPHPNSPHTIHTPLTGLDASNSQVQAVPSAQIGHYCSAKVSPFTDSFIHSLTHSLTHSLIHHRSVKVSSCTDSLTHLTHSPTHSPTHSLTHLCPTDSLTHLLTYSLTHLL